jgi:hypothetical protein
MVSPEFLQREARGEEAVAPSGGAFLSVLFLRANKERGPGAAGGGTPRAFLYGYRQRRFDRCLRCENRKYRSALSPEAIQKNFERDTHPSRRSRLDCASAHPLLICPREHIHHETDEHIFILGIGFGDQQRQRSRHPHHPPKPGDSRLDSRSIPLRVPVLHCLTNTSFPEAP